MNKIIKEALVLMAITLVSGLLLGAVYSITKQPIAQAEEKAQKEAYLAVFPDAQDLTEPDNKEELLTEAADVLDQAGFGTADTLEDFYLAEKDGAVTGVDMNITSHEGYGGDINFSMGVSMDGTVTGVEMLSLSETAGLGMRAKTDPAFLAQFNGASVDKFTVVKDGTGSSSEDKIDAIGGSTVTSKAVTKGINTALAVFKELKSENVKTVGGASIE